MEEVKGHIQRLNAENIDMLRRLDKLEDSDRRHEQDIKQLFAHQEGTKVYVAQILQKLEGLETRLFTLVTNLTTSQEKDRNAERKDRSKTTQLFIEFSKWVIGGTVFAIVLYLFQGGGK